jgi:type VI protein secretion system component Hcp
MLVCRIYETDGKRKVHGSCTVRGYEAGGWFPINSFGFGFDPEKHQKKGRDKNDGGKGPGGGTPGGRPSTPIALAPQQKGLSAKDTDDSTVKISKPIDTGTCDLMQLAMEDRKKKKGIESKLMADIHLLSFIDIAGRRATFPNLMVHLEAVLVRDWNVEASGDDRPEESLELRYDRAAMKYVATTDGKVFIDCPARGWDQTADKSFTWEDSKWKDFTKNMEFKNK